MKVLMTASRNQFDSLQNANRNADMCALLDSRLNITAVPVRGVWKGESEASYMFAGVDAAGVAYCHELANLYEQDAILVIGDDKRCTLIDGNGERLDIGDWHQVPRDIAVQFDGYSVIGGDYYIAATHDELVQARRRILSTQAAVIARNEYDARTAAVSGYMGV